MTLLEIQERATARAKEAGFHSLNRTFGDDLMLVTSELAEALEEFRNGRRTDEIYYSKLCTCKEEDECCINCGQIPKPEGIPIEIADAIIRLANMAGRWGFDLEKAVIQKMDYNETRPFLHGGKRL